MPRDGWPTRAGPGLSALRRTNSRLRYKRRFRLGRAAEECTLGEDRNISLVSGGIAATLSSDAARNSNAVLNFDVGQLVNLASKAASSRLPLGKPWADRIGDLSEPAADPAMKAKE